MWWQKVGRRDLMLLTLAVGAAKLLTRDGRRKSGGTVDGQNEGGEEEASRVGRGVGEGCRRRRKVEEEGGRGRGCMKKTEKVRSMCGSGMALTRVRAGGQARKKSKRSAQG